MDASLRNTPALVAKIGKSTEELIKRFENIIGHARIVDTDRNLTASTQYQIQVDTAALIRAAEELQVLIRQMQETWLFGQLDTMGERDIEQQTDQSAKAVAEMLGQLMERQPQTTTTTTTMTTE